MKHRELLSEPQTQNVILRPHEIRAQFMMCGLYRKRQEIILNFLDWLQLNFQIDKILWSLQLDPSPSISAQWFLYLIGYLVNSLVNL